MQLRLRAKKKSTVTSKKIKFIEIPSDADLSGTKVYEGSAACDGQTVHHIP